MTIPSPLNICIRVTSLSLVLFDPVFADTIIGTNDSDNNSFSFFPVWRSQLTGTSRNDRIIGLAGDDLLYGQNGDDVLIGGSGRDRLFGERGNDQLAGGFGDRDELVGGSGNDIYSIVDSFDIIRESINQGHDVVYSYINYVLPDTIEDLWLMPSLNGTDVIYGGNDGNRTVNFFSDCAGSSSAVPCRQLGYWAMGNELDNEIRGNGLRNLLFGRGGNDILWAGAAGDTVRGGAGNDYLAGFSINGSHWSLEHDWLTGGPGADIFVTGFSEHPDGLLNHSGNLSLINRERFPQYLGQGRVTITDFNWREGDKIEVYGALSDYSVSFYFSEYCNDYCAYISWSGTTSTGFRQGPSFATVTGLRSQGDLIPAYDFLVSN